MSIAAELLRRNRRRTPSPAVRRAEVDRRRNLLEYEEGRRKRSSELRRSLASLRSRRAARALPGGFTGAGLRRNLLDEFAAEDRFQRARLGLQNERLGIQPEPAGDESALGLLGGVFRRLPAPPRLPGAPGGG